MRKISLSNPFKFKIYQLFWSVVLISIFPKALFSQLNFNNGDYAIDTSLKIIICNQFPSSFSSTNVFKFGSTFEMSSSVKTLKAGDKFDGTFNGENYTTYFTDLPILKISSPDPIIKESDVQGDLSILDKSGNVDYATKIKIRGQTSATWEKKPYRLTLQTPDRSGNLKASLFGLREDKRWLLLAMYNEHTKVNNKVSHDLWMEMHQLYYKNEEPDALSSIRSLYVYLFVNGGFNGVYLLTENTDRKQLQLKKTKEDGTVRGELYKSKDHGVPGFNELVSKGSPGTEVWGDWEMKYPDYETYNWDNLYDLTYFVRESTGSEFNSEIGDRIKIDNIIDYYIFINLILAEDNTGKNSFIAKYKQGEPYFFIVWDLDGTWGFNWYGGRQENEKLKMILGNTLTSRLKNNNPDNYKQKLAGRWFSLRENLFKKSTLYARIDNQYNYLTENNVFELEHIKWNYGYNVSSEYSYMKNWITQRLDSLDVHFDKMVDGCAAPSVNLANANFTNGESANLVANGCSGVVKWYNQPSGGSILHVGNNINTSKIYDNATYYAECVIGSCVSSSRTKIVVTTGCSNKELEHNSQPLVATEYKSSEKIEGRVPITGATRYYSGRSVVLNPGFEADTGKLFEAIIEGCD